LTDVNLLSTLVLILAAATAGGLLALWLKQPVIIGYLIGGLVIGPFTPGPKVDFSQFRLFTEIGLALLLFILGSRMRPSRFVGLGKIILLGGSIQIILTIGLGFVFTIFFGFSSIQGFLLGLILTQSSSAVMSKVLDDRNETDSIHGRIAIGVSAVQDISSVPLLILLLTFMGEDNSTASSLIMSLISIIILAIIIYIIGKFLLHRLMLWLERFTSQEVTLLTVLVLALGFGILLQEIGLSIALGAFLAGLMIAESPHRSNAVSGMMPLRDIFAAVFFVSIGSLFVPAVIWEDPLLLLGLLTILILGKTFIGAVVTRSFGQNRNTSIMTGLLLAQIGEFAFILALIGLDRGAISQEIFSVIMAAAVISIFVNSLILDSAPPVLLWLARTIKFTSLIKGSAATVRSTLRGRRSPRIVPPSPPRKPPSDLNEE
jgi:CPA2 family monovalent cation:H+ antiporter-2